MKELRESFEGKGEMKGFIFTQLQKTDKCYLYEVKTEGHIGYEVFQHKINTHFNCISYPSSKAFGVWAWYFRDKNKAITKLKEITGHICKGCGSQISYDVEYCGECICEDDMDI
jgi:hypothetical protein